MSQSKRKSMIESATQVVIGYVVANILWIVIGWYEDTGLTFATNVKIVSIFTFFSVIRSYGVRRWFNRGERK